MTEDDIKLIKEAMEGIRRAINAFAHLQDRMGDRSKTWSAATHPSQSLHEWAGWQGLAQGWGHILLHIYQRLDMLVGSYYEAKAKMEASPAPPNPDEGVEIPQTPMPDFMKDLDFPEGGIA